MKDRVLILGAAGFIGRRLVAALQETDWAVPICGLHRAPLSIGLVQQAVLDATDRAALMRVMASVEGVVNCVAGSAETIMATAKNLSSVSRQMSCPPRIVHLSTMSVYGSVSGSVYEDSPLKGDTGAYALAKLQAERLVMRSPEVVILRPGCVYGPGGTQWSEYIARLLRGHRLGDLGSSGDGYCNLVHVDDVVAAILKALRIPGVAGEVFNLGTPAPPTWNEYFVSFARALGAVPIRRISRRQLLLEARFLAPPLKAADWASDLAQLNLQIPTAITSPLLRLWRQEIRLDVTKAEAVLGISWTPTEVGLRDTAALLSLSEAR